MYPGHEDKIQKRTPRGRSTSAWRSPPPEAEDSLRELDTTIQDSSWSCTTTTTAATKCLRWRARPRRQNSALRCPVQPEQRRAGNKEQGHERVPVLRVPGHRPATDGQGDGRAAVVLDACAHHADEFRHDYSGAASRATRTRGWRITSTRSSTRQLGHARREAAAASSPARPTTPRTTAVATAFSSARRPARSSSRLCPRTRSGDWVEAKDTCRR